MKATELQKALESSITSCQPSDYWKNHMVRQIVKGEEMSKRTKLSTGIILVAVLMLVSAVALAVGILVNDYYAKVAEMDASGALGRWNLEDKITFVRTMQECGFEIDPELYQTAMNENVPESQREEAANRIVDATYGALIRQQQGYYISEPEDSFGVAPDPVIVFQERYFAEHPEPIDDTPEGRERLLAYTDALGYYLRDTYNPFYMQAHEGQGEMPEKTEIDEDGAVECLKGYMTEILGWDPEEVEHMTPDVEWDKTYRMWTLSGEVSAASMEKVTDRRKGIEPTLEGSFIEKTEKGYRVTILVDEKGNWSLEYQDKEAFRKLHIDDAEPVVRIESNEAMKLVEQAIMQKYHLAESELNVLFCDAVPAGLGENNEQMYLMKFHTHYQMNQEMKYGAVINLATGTVEAVFSYETEKWPDEGLRLLDYCAEREWKEGWYIHWSTDSKETLVRKMKEIGMLPDHEFWNTKKPSEAQIDALVAEAFGVPGYPSAVNAAVMIQAVAGPADSWDWTTRCLMEYLIEKYHIHSDSLAGKIAGGSEEVSQETAAEKVKSAVCSAWNMPEGSLQDWQCTVQLVQSPTGTQHGSMVFYRVFLTRPDSELGQDTFGGKDNFNYRILLDGTIVDSTMVNGWYSPAEDAQRWGNNE